jgi:iron complex outermembrane receptor protein
VGFVVMLCIAACMIAGVTHAQVDSDSDSREEDDPFGDVEQFIVYGSGSNVVALDATVSVTAFNAEDLVALGADELSDVAAFTPNLEIRTTGGTAATFFIRGVGLNDFTANASGAVAIYQDDIALNAPALQLGQLFDVEDVQVLRGPQGTGAGRNASGGAIKIYSRKPTGEFDAKFRSEIGTFDGSNAISQDYEGALEVPIVSGVLSSRFAFRVNVRDGFMDNRCGNAPPLDESRITNPSRVLQGPMCNENVGSTPLTTIDNPTSGPSPLRISGLPAGLAEDMNDVDNWATRGQFRFQPPDQSMDWILNLHGGRVDQLARVGVALGTEGFRETPEGGIQGYLGGRTEGYRQPEIIEEENQIFEDLGGLDVPIAQRGLIRGEARTILGEKLAKRLDRSPFAGDYNRDGPERMTTLGGFLRGEFDLDDFQLTTITGIEHYDREIDTDSDYTPNQIFETDTQDDATQFTQDLRIEGELDSQPLTWNGGGYFLYEELDYESQTASGSAVVGLHRIYEQTTVSVGVYGGFEWEFLDDLTLEGGARYNWESKKFEVHLFRGGARDVCGPPLDPNDPRAAPAQDCTDRPTWDSPTGTISLRYHFTEETSAYWKYSRGWKGGQLNAGGAAGQAFTLASPESIDSFEVGFGGSWLAGRLSLSGAAFYYLYEDYQVFTSQNEPQAPPQRIVINASDAQLYGAELEAKANPLEGLNLTTRFAWIESEFLDFSQRVFRSVPTDPEEPPIIAPVDLQFTGNRLPNTPRFTVSGSVEYAWDLRSLGTLTPRYDFAWSEDITFDQSKNGRGAPNNDGVLFLPENTIGQRAYWIHNFRIGYRPLVGHIEVAAWVRNFTNTLYKRLAFDASQVGLVGAIPGDPRSFGFSLTLDW